MKLSFISALLLTSALGVCAQSKINPAGNMMLFQWNEAKISSVKTPAARLAVEKSPVVKAIISVTPGTEPEDVLLSGMELDCVLPTGTIIADIPLNLVSELENNDAVTGISFGDVADINLDTARKSTGVDLVHAGTGIKSAFTGKGVLCGIYDTGIDPNHITFTNGEKRVLAFFNGSTTYTQANMANAMPDTQDGTHGTHCAGILAGNGAPRATATYIDRTVYGESNIRAAGYFNGRTFVPMANPYQGVAKGAYLYMVGGQGYDASILSGVNRIIKYGKENNLPTVVSLSWGSVVGPHDGSRAICRELDELSKDAIIVIAAGNEGHLNVSVKKKFTASDNSLSTFINGSGNAIGNMAQFWANDSKTLKLAVGVYNLQTNSIVKTQDVSASASGTSVNLAALSSDAFNSGSSITAQGGVDAGNKRAYISLNFNINLKDNTKFVPFLKITGENGQEIMGVCHQNLSFSSRNVSGFTAGTPAESISDMACGENVIVVGAYTNRTSYTFMPYNSPRYVADDGNKLEDIAYFSSYGTVFGGRNLPDVCAPGAQVISSISSFYTAKNGYSPISSNSASAYYHDSSTKRTYFFEIMQGTSMATPFAAGVIGLWLEANPNLTTQDVKNIIAKTSTKDDFVTNGNPVRWGAGKINAIEGIKEILSASVDEIGIDSGKRLIIEKLSARNFRVTLPGAERLDLRLISMSGAEIISNSAADQEITLDAEALPSGIYILEARDSRGVYTEKIIL